MDNPNRPEPRTILVVDDEPAMHKLIQFQLSRRNFNIISCLDSEKVVDYVTKHHPDLVLMDLMMPELDGISATQRIRNMELNSYLPIIMVTAKREIRDIVAALEAGADDYITKPFEIEELAARIKTMLRLKELNDSLMMKTHELDQANQQITRLNQVLVETNRKLQKKVYNLHNLFEISFDVMGKTVPAELINTALLHALGIFAAKSAMLMVTNQENPDIFEVIDSKGFLHEKVQDFKVLRHDKLVHYLELIKKPFQIQEVTREFKEIIPELKKMEIRVVAPLFRNEEIIGILCLGPNVTEDAYSEDVLEMVGIVANMLSVALHNAENFDKIRAMSYTDDKTGLHNYRFFKLRLKEELARARRVGSSLSLLILDVDFFKNYNDTLGHPAGDEVLRQLADILKNIVRDNDIVARYGGEEFSLILPSTNRRGAEALAERIRKRIEKHKFPQEEIQPNGTLTCSLGVATYPDDAVVIEDLIIAADRALYHAKKTGRNRVVSYSKMNDPV